MNFSIFSKNFADSGGAIFMLNYQPLSILILNSCLFIENNSTTTGGAIYMKNFGKAEIYRSNFSKNFADLGGAISCFNQSIKKNQILGVS